MSDPLQSAEALLFDVGFRPHSAQFVRLSEADYRQEPFLDQRLLQSGQRQHQFVPLDRLLDARAELGGGHPGFIFHIGHVGSTLISRLLAEARTVLPVREPQVLRTLSLSYFLRETPESLVSPGAHADMLRLTVRLLGRPLGGRTQPVVKATSVATLLSREIAALTDSPLLGLTATAKTYLATIFGGEGSRREAIAFAPLRRKMIARHIPAAAFAVHELSEGELTAMCWLAGVLDLAALKIAAAERAMIADFSIFLNAPATELQRIAAHMRIDLSAEAAQRAVAGPIMQTYSKAQEHAYSPALRSQVIGNALVEHETEIARGLRWLERLADTYPAASRAVQMAGL